jgi:hypothetical protein
VPPEETQSINSKDRSEGNYRVIILASLLNIGMKEQQKTRVEPDRLWKMKKDIPEPF